MDTIKDWITPTPSTSLVTASTVFAASRERLEYLYNRWQDEREYEDFDEYKAVMKKTITDAGATFVRMTQRPMAVTFKVAPASHPTQGGTPGGLYEIRINARKVQLFAARR